MSPKERSETALLGNPPETSNAILTDESSNNVLLAPSNIKEQTVPNIRSQVKDPRMFFISKSNQLCIEMESNKIRAMFKVSFNKLLRLIPSNLISSNFSTEFMHTPRKFETLREKPRQTVAILICQGK